MRQCAIFLLLLCAGCARTYSGVSGPEEAMYRALDCYGKQVAKENNVELLIVGNATDDKEVVYCLTWRSQKEMTLEDARKVVPSQIQQFVTVLRKSPEVHEFIQYATTHYPYTPKTFDKKQVAWRLVFWDKNVERPKPPYLAEVLYKNETIYYYQQDPVSSGLKLCYTEPFSGEK